MKDMDKRSLLKIARNVLAGYSLVVEKIVPARGGITNASFFVKTKKQEYVLRIYADDAELQDVLFEVKALNIFAANNLPVAEVVPNRQGKFVVSVSVGLGVRHAILMKKLSGRIVRSEDYKLVPTIASMQAKLHLVAGSHIKPRRSTAKTLYYTELWLLDEAKHAARFMARSGVYGEYKKQLKVAIEDLRFNAKILKDLSSAECHLDYDSDNILTDGKQITGVLDFGDIKQSPLVMDIGNSLFWWLFCNPRRQAKQIFEAYIAAYEKVRPMTSQEKQLIFLCMKIRSLGLAAYFYGHGFRRGGSYLQKTTQFNVFIDKLKESLGK